MKIEKFLNESPIFASILLYDRLARNASDRLKEENLGVLDALILVAIAMEKDETVSPRALAVAFEMKASNLSHSLKRLVEQGFVSRESHPSDRRKWILKPSPEGRKCVNRLIKFFDQGQERLEQTLGVSKIKVLCGIAKKLGVS